MVYAWRVECGTSTSPSFFENADTRHDQALDDDGVLIIHFGWDDDPDRFSMTFVNHHLLQTQHQNHRNN